jgi:hypothetical protein
VKRTAAVLLCALASTPALAQSKTPERQTAPAAKASVVTLPCDPLNLPPGCVSAAGVTSDASNSGDLWAKIVNASIADLTYAQALAKAANTVGSNLRAVCYGAILTANQQANGNNVLAADKTPLAKPNPAVITTLEQGAEVLDELQPTAPVMVACAPAANAAKQDVLTFVSTVLAGVAVKAATAGVLP